MTEIDFKADDFTLCQAEEWLYFHQGQARATVFLGGAIARTFDFTAGDTAVFPDNSGTFLILLPPLKVQVAPFPNTIIYTTTILTQSTHQSSGHYIENTSPTEKLIWIELYKSDRVADVSLTQWLALTPPGIVASTLKIPLDVVNSLKKEKQLLIAAKT